MRTFSARYPRAPRRRGRLFGQRARAVRLGGVLAAAALATAAASAQATVHLSAGAYFAGKSSACHRPTTPGATCKFIFRAVSGGFGLRFVGHTVVSRWSCPKRSREALLGGNVSGNLPVPQLSLASDGTLSGRAGTPPNRVTASGRIGEAGTKVIVTFRHARCTSPRVTLIEGAAPPGGH